MSLFKRLMRFARIVFDKPGVESEMDEELRFHIEAETEENVRRGMWPNEAHRAALVNFGGLERFKEQGRSARGGRSPYFPDDGHWNPLAHEIAAEVVVARIRAIARPRSADESR